MNYEINSNTLLILPTDNGKSKAIEKKNEYVVEESTFNVIEHSCEYFGSSYEGRHIGTKKLIKAKYKTPIVIEESQNLIFFPTMSPESADCMWVSLKNIRNYRNSENKAYSIIDFNNGDSIEVNISFGSLQNQILRATRLNNVILERKTAVTGKSDDNNLFS